MKDWSTGKNYDAVDFLGEALAFHNGEAIRGFTEIANGHEVTSVPAPISRAKQNTETRRPDISRLRRATKAEVEQVANSRNIDPRAVHLAQDLDTLRIGPVCGYLSWVLLDASALLH